MYCVLYDQGYTSLGEKHNSQKNPYLKIEETDNYKPAYELTKDDYERFSRRDANAGS
jgi:FAD synthetase